MQSGIASWFYERELYLPEPGHANSRVLRNLSKRVFVRSDTLNEIMIGRPENRGLGSVLVAHICWSTNPNTATPYEDLHRGIWAGDRFDIVPLKDFDLHAEETGGPGWEDVTASVASTMVDIWEADFAGRGSWRCRLARNVSYRTEVSCVSIQLSGSAFTRGTLR